uniref:Uncharacterized protein n=1 Tax=Oryza rufipogon TaxID=4529 RepID=A0A0E0PLF3_ORYRU
RRWEGRHGRSSPAAPPSSRCRLASYPSARAPLRPVINVSNRASLQSRLPPPVATASSVPSRRAPLRPATSSPALSKPVCYSTGQQQPA